MAKQAKVWTGSAWIEFGSNGAPTTYYQSAAPSAPSDGDIWVDSDSASAYADYVNNGVANNKGEVLVATGNDVVGIQSVASANNQVLVADSSTSTGVKWAISPALQVFDAAGDLIVGTGADTAAKLGIGGTGQVLTVVSGTPAWADDTPHPLLFA
jgi:hypothetical protein